MDLDMSIEITSKPNLEDDEFIIAKTREYNSQFIENRYEPLSIYFRDSKKELIGGLTGKTFWDWLHVEYLWVSEKYRKSGVGSKILLAAEEEAKERSCIGSTLDTFSFQALGFYKKLGYSIVGTLPEYRGGHKRYYLKKRLG
ncbi:MAG: GNAT family N-acetyltransferase [Flavobacteriales bacterium]|nr:GNAT family N-acetyltransferase [Flavobacteriales bacterium]